MTIKLMVVVWGLVLFAPEKVYDGNGVPVAEEMTILFTDPVGPPVHKPRYWLVDGDGVLGQPENLPEEFSIDLDQGETPTTIILEHSNYFAELSELIPGATINDECKKNRPACDDDQAGQDLVHGVVDIRGVWRASSASVCDDELYLPVSYHDWAQYSYRNPSATIKRPGGPFPLATAMRLDAELDGNSITIHLNGEDVELDIMNNSKCREWMGEGVTGKCAVLILGNPPLECQYSTERLSHHFRVNYAGLVNFMGGPHTPWLPYVENDPGCPDDPSARNLTGCLGAAPAVRCPPAMVTP